jgi:hypothetical protein
LDVRGRRIPALKRWAILNGALIPIPHSECRRGNGFFSSKLGIVVSGLTPGTTYVFEACTHGAGNLTSAWSPPVSIMCT